MAAHQDERAAARVVATMATAAMVAPRPAPAPALVRVEGRVALGETARHCCTITSVMREVDKTASRGGTREVMVGRQQLMTLLKRTTTRETQLGADADGAHRVVLLGTRTATKTAMAKATITVAMNTGTYHTASTVLLTSTDLSSEASSMVTTSAIAFHASE